MSICHKVRLVWFVLSFSYKNSTHVSYVNEPDKTPSSVASALGLNSLSVSFMEQYVTTESKCLIKMAENGRYLWMDEWMDDSRF